MERISFKDHEKILNDANEFMTENAREFEAVCQQLAEVVNGKSLSMGILTMQTVLASLMASDTDNPDDLYIRVMVLIHAHMHNPEAGNFNLINKEMLN